MKALSKKAELSESYVHAILKQGRTPSIDNFLRIATACGVEPCWLLFGDNRFRIQFPVIGRARQKDVWQPVNRDNVEKVHLPARISNDLQRPYKIATSEVVRRILDWRMSL